MSKAKKPRNKSYRPRQQTGVGGLTAFAKIYARGEDASPLRDDQLADLGAGYMLALVNLASGNASEESWECVVCALNIGLALAESVFNHQHETDIVAALDGMFRAKIRNVRGGGNFRLDGDGLRDVKYALAVHDEQMKLAQRREIVAAMETVQARIKDGNVYSVEAIA